MTSIWKDWVHMEPKFEETQGKCNGQSWSLGLCCPISEAGHSPPLLLMEQGLCSGHSMVHTPLGPLLPRVLSLVGLKDTTQKSLEESLQTAVSDGCVGGVSDWAVGARVRVRKDFLNCVNVLLLL